MVLSNEKRKLLQRLRNSRFRAREGQFIVEGVRGTVELLRGSIGLKSRFALISPRLQLSPRRGELEELLRERGVPLQAVSDDELAVVSDTESSQGVLLVVKEPENLLPDLSRKLEPRILILDGIQDPGNVGTLIRAAWAFGLDGVLALEGTVDPFNPKVVRATSGALGHVPVVRSLWESVRPWLQEREIPLLVADPGGVDVRMTAPYSTWALAIGNEAAGPREELVALSASMLGIRMDPAVDSLNAGVAGAILMFALDPSSAETPEP
jgi:TrmH family RNA methyltransferase